jgi:hydroxypyruvate reductase
LAIASGPTVAAPAPFGDAFGVLERYALAADFADLVEFLRARATGGGVRSREEDGGERDAEHRARDPIDGIASADHHAVLASNAAAVEAVRGEAEARGFRAVVVSTRMQGEARDAGRLLGGLAASTRRGPVGRPACLILGGETVVTVRGDGAGGRNQETALAAAAALEGVERAAVFSFATDGVDGPTEAAGAFATGETAARSRTIGLSIDQALARNDSFVFFQRLGDLWVTGPTGTNVNDVAVALVYP